LGEQPSASGCRDHQGGGEEREDGDAHLVVELPLGAVRGRGNLFRAHSPDSRSAPTGELAVPPLRAYPSSNVVVLGGMVGAILGFLVGLLITEVIVGNPANGSGFDWQLWTDVVLAIVGAVAGSSFARQLVNRRVKAS